MTHYRDIDYSNLGWVRKELNATLNEVSHALEAYVAEPADIAQLRFCVTYLHQVRAILQMLELYGASMLAEEMEALAQALVDDRVGQRHEAYEVLVRAILQLSDYLERIEHGRRDMPMLMLPLMNDLRAMRGAHLLTENALFNPDLKRTPVKLAGSWTEANDVEARARARQLRPIYQLALLGWLRKRGTDNLRRLGEVLRRLEVQSTVSPAATLWWIGGGVIEALYLKALEPNVAVNMLLGHLDRQIKRLADQGERTFEESPAVDLAKNLLYYVAQSDSLGERVVQIQQLYNLKALMPRADELDKAREEMSGPTVAMLETVANAIKEDLTSVKDSLDMSARSGVVAASDLRPLQEILRRVADTLGMLGLGLARKVVIDQSALLQRMIDQEVVADEQRLIEAASALLFVEAEVDDLLTPGARRAEATGSLEAPTDDSLLEAEFHRVMALVVKEALADLTRAKDILIDYSVSPENHERLSDVPALFRSVAGAMNMVNMQPAAQVLRGLLQFLVEQVIQPRRAPTRDHFDELAETISSLEYYLESVRDRRAQTSVPLRNATESLVRLQQLPATVDVDAAIPYQVAVGKAAEGASDSYGHDMVERLGAETSAQDATPAPEMEVIELSALPLPEVEPAEFAESLPWLVDGADTEILEVFYEETDELQETLNTNLSVLHHDPSEREALTNVRRVYHTLKGSGRLAGSPMIGEFFWVCEQVLNQVLASTSPSDANVVGFIAETARALPELVGRLRTGKSPNFDPMQFIERIEQQYNIPRSAARSVNSKSTKPAKPVSDEEDPEPATEIGSTNEQDAFAEAFRAEASGAIRELKNFVDAIETGQSDGSVNAPILSTISKLNNVANEAGVVVVSRLLTPLATHLQAVHTQKKILTPAAVNLLGEAVALFEAIQAAPETTEADVLGFSEMLSRAAALGQENATAEVAAIAPEPAKVPPSPVQTVIDADLVTLFLEEAEETVGYLESTSREWRANPLEVESLQGLQRALHTLKGGARMAGFKPVAELSHAMESLLVSVKELAEAPPTLIFDEFQLALDCLIELLELAAASKAIEVPHDKIARLQAIHPGVMAENDAGGAADSKIGSDRNYDDQQNLVDTELAQVFLEESVETLVGAESALQRWKDHPGDQGPVADLQRLLHTLKGGARMAGFVPIGNLAHQMESLVARVVQRGGEPEPTIFELFDLCYDRLLEMLERARSGKPVGSVADLVDQLESLRFDVAAKPKVDVAEDATREGDVASATMADIERIKPRLQNDMVRVSADLLDRLVGYAGEISIYRARLGQQVNAIGFNVVELEQTVVRLREQLRRLEIEAEAQIIFRNEDMYSASREGFDALEFDRFSQLQQLSRALAESVGDLVSIQSLLASLARESEVLLGQQARLNTELQEGLTHTRMVPFSSLMPRLRRIVRQTAHELGKRAELEIIGADGEMDRTVLERVTAPLEHMLRNALAHGIESPSERKRAGKSEVGRISVRLARESSEVLMVVGDDGAGMDIDAIRRKALQRGLIKDDSKLSDHEIMQFVLEAGFSTAQQVTQIAGRGVGMDVVHSEIKQMGGSLTINSARGKGTSFSARLPFTLAINQALLVYAGPEVYAIPLAAIEGVARVTQEELQRCERYEDGFYNYASQRYIILNLSYLLGLGEPDWSSPAKRVPLLLVQAGDQRMALQVDGLMGSREIVVKSVGPQLSSIAGLMGATILGDGRIVLILDIIALARIGIALKAEGPNANVPRRVDLGGKIRVMVVDDSITVRKVTARFLERNNMAVVTAKDGVDAIARLNEEIPDVMLLDIEMPRMDGFELATHVRNDPKLRQLPIIMITSRTGDKHRQRAMDIGVDRYLGKPYQESELLENIVSVLSGARVYG
jgi:chemosensory pili system protein ChpA (sensor histidine kinase/response regulator)